MAFSEPATWPTAAAQAASVMHVANELAKDPDLERWISCRKPYTVRDIVKAKMRRAVQADLSRQANDLAQKWEALTTEMTLRFGTTHEGEEYVTAEADEVLQEHVFWWTWGN